MGVVQVIIGAGLLVLLIVLQLISFFTTAFLEKITLVNSFVLAVASGICLYLCNRSFDAFFSFQVHPAICVVVGIAIFFLAFFLQSTKVGFWIFTIIFSALWAFVTALIVYLFITKDTIWIYVALGLSFIVNIGSHLRAKANGEVGAL